MSNGVVQAFSACFVCRQPFFYNPMRVPSIRVEGSREPICQACVDHANVVRAGHGLPPIVPLPGAYDPADAVDWSALPDEGDA